MPNIYTEWDYELKQEVFKVTGDKGYTRKTGTLLEEVNYSPQTKHLSEYIEYYVAKFKLNVLRDIGASHIVFYDNGKAIPFTIEGVEYTQYEWTDQSAITYAYLKLTYGIEHNITVRYMGNKHCLPSTSKPVVVYEALPNKFLASLSKTTDPVQFDDKTSISFDLLFTRGEASNSAENKEVKIYLNGTLKKTVTYAFSANARTKQRTIAFSVTNEGLHTVKCVYEGDEYLSEAHLTFQISVGYQLSFPSYPKKFIVSDSLTEYYASNNQFQVRVFDWFGNPCTTGSVSASSDYTIPDADVNSDGIATFTANQGFGNDGCTVTYANTSKHISSIATLQVNDIVVSADPTIASQNTPATISATISDYTWLTTKTHNLKDIPVAFKVGDTDLDPVLTDSEGTALVSQSSSNKNDLTVSSKIGSSAWESVTVETVLQYWSPSLTIGREYEMHGGSSMTDLSKGYLIQFSRDGRFAYIAMGNGKDTVPNYEISFRFVQGRKETKILAYSWNSRNGNYNANVNWTQFENYPTHNWSDGTCTIRKENNYITIWRNGTMSYASYPYYSNDLPLIMMQCLQGGASTMSITNLKFKEL